ncbi:Mini-ribonuclease 3 [Leptolyngbya sp. NK1-12]|uniref:Mini-ribonuclease 3 n=1 Tax=Leptolyngbya sp. NK1-12 TaxID=2547451 RepID=A0AA96WJG6_9CYAN|nr:Mini-ribonuclease 3 [Leptolyngbya sp. NK1-12]
MADRQLIGLSAALLSSEASPLNRLVQIQQLSPAALAYIGDAVYELYVRTHYLLPPKKLHTYHEQVVAQVRAESQARHLQSLQPHLTEAESDLIRRGRNAASKRQKRVDAEIYQQATGLETLLGYLYLCDPERLVELLGQLQLMSEETTEAMPASPV